MYDELYSAWLGEIENSELVRLPTDFYTRLADYLKRIKEETRMLDKKTIKVALLEHELQNVKRMLQELVWTRYDKLIKLIATGQKPPADALTTEETQVVNGISPFADAYHRFATTLLQGQQPRIDVTDAHKRVVLRFTKGIPAIIGADMKTYWPFLAEDIASVPAENAKILVKQGLAEIVEFS